MTKIQTMLGQAVACALTLLLALPCLARADESLKFNIATQPLVPALKAFAEQANMQLLYKHEAVEGATANAVIGQYDKHEALVQLVQGTGLEIVFTDDDSAIIRHKAAANKQGAVKAEAMGLRLAQAFEHQGSKSSETEDSSADESGSSSSKLEEIVVTAQKRVESLQDVPISISVLSGADLDRSTSRGVAEALSRVPGVLVTEANQGSGTQLTVRGVSSTQAHFFGTSTVAYYVDSMPYGTFNSATAPDSNVYDLSRIEVLRGPQGTLYGSSALSGVVRVLTHDADLNDFGLKARTTLSSTKGGEESYRGDVALNLPLVPGKLAARIVGGYDDLGGWIDKPNQKDANAGLVKNLRLKVNAQPTEALSVGLAAWLSREDYDSPNTSDEPGRNSSTAREFSWSEFDMYGLKIGYDFPGVSLSSATSYMQHANQSDVGGALGLLFPPGFSINTLFDGDQWAEELTLISSHEGPWRWSLGSMYREMDQTFEQFLPGINTPIPQYLSSESLAVFGEATRLFHDGEFELTGGLRYFEDTQRTVDGGTLASYKASFDAISPRVVFTWHPSERLTAYASYSEGFRSGAPSGELLVSSGIPPLEPDTLTNYEIGAKGSLWAGRLSFDTAVFYMDWQDVQESLTVLSPVTNGPVAARVNGDSASGLGVDFAATVVPAKGLALGVTLGWNDLTMDSDVFTGDTLDVLLRAKGERFNYSPEWTAGVSADYEFPLGGAGFEGRLSASANYTSTQLYALYLGGPERYLTSGEEMIVGRASFGIEAPKDWSATLFVDNVTDEEGPAIYAPTASPLFTPRIRPRTIGVQVDYRFGN